MTLMGHRATNLLNPSEWVKFCRSHACDFSAGLSLIGLLIPEAVAYAGIAGLPPSAGLIALICGLLIYTAVGSCRTAVVSATSSSAMVLAATVSSLLATHQQAHPETLAAVLVMMTGFWFILARLLGFGRTSSFIAKPVLRGVTMGLAFTITLMQLPKLLGLHATGSGLWGRLLDTISHIHEVSPSAAALGLGSLAVLLLWRWQRLPGSLIVVAAAVLLSYFVPLETLGIELVGPFSLERTAISFQTLAGADWIGTIQMSAALCLMVYAESYSSIHAAAERSGQQTVPNRDIVAIGLSNMASGFFGGLAVGAGFSATSLNIDSGARSRVSNFFALAVLFLALAFLMPQISRIPEPVLAAVVIKAVSGGLSPEPIRPYFEWKRDRLLVIASFCSVTILGVLNGLLISVVLSVALILIRVSQPHVSVMQKLPGSHSFVNTKLFPDTVPIPGVLVLRMDQPLVFANAEESFKKARALLTEQLRRQPLKEIVVSMEEAADLDGTCVEEVLKFAQFVKKAGCTLTLCRMHRRAREVLVGAANPILSPDRLSYLSVDRAVKEAQERILFESRAPESFSGKNSEDQKLL
ncbi:MAG: SulP family inorganic anion transporter [Mesosutterella sp.]|nr:SulP family inorganic anion transporter [Mesosutterella sp.]